MPSPHQHPPHPQYPGRPDPALLTLPLKLLPDPLPIPVITRPFRIAITPPGSKSLTNRAVLLAALSRGTSVLRGPLLEADDTERMLEAVTQLGATVERMDTGDLRISGVAGRWNPASPAPTLNLHNAGTATRFLAAAAILCDPLKGPVTIDGNERMRERPIGELVDALRTLGVKVEYARKEGFPPIRVHPPQSLTELDSQLTFGRTASSQFISALLLIAPWLPKGLTIYFSQTPTSPSYISMTTGLLRRCGFQVKGEVYAPTFPHEDEGLPPAPPSGLRTRPAAEPVGSDPDAPPSPPPPPPPPPPGPITVFPAEHLRSHDRIAPGGMDITIEPDASSATYFTAAAAIAPRSSVTIRALTHPSLQGDADFLSVLRACGAEVQQSPRGTYVRGRQLPVDPFAYDFTNMPDAAMTAAAVACFAQGRSILSGLATLRVKETDRIAAMQAELSKIGVSITSERGPNPSTGQDDELLFITTPDAGNRPIDCGPSCQPVVFDTYDDHRMAMSLALIGLHRPNVAIRNPACVAKTYPDFWRDFARVYDELKR